MAHTKKGRKVALVAGLALVVLSVAMVWNWREIRALKFERLGKNAQAIVRRRLLSYRAYSLFAGRIGIAAQCVWGRIDIAIAEGIRKGRGAQEQVREGIDGVGDV